MAEPSTTQISLLYHFCRLRLPRIHLPLGVFERHLRRAYGLARPKRLKAGEDAGWATFLETPLRPRLVPGLCLPGRAFPGVGNAVRLPGQPYRQPAGGRPAGPGGPALPARRGTPGTVGGRLLGLPAGRGTRGLGADPGPLRRPAAAGALADPRLSEQAPVRSPPRQSLPAAARRRPA